MKTLKRLCAVLAIAVVSHAASAREAGLSQQYESCMNSKSADSTLGMVNCSQAEKNRQDDQLNKSYKALMAQLTPLRQEQLLQAQRAWIKYRDTNCAFYFDPEGGTLAQVEASSCFMLSTAERARELEMFSQGR